jgi:cell division transport system ATP-binding protein
MITFDSVSKVYKKHVEALKGCSAKIEKGEFVFLVGPSGSGKSTFLRLVLKEERPNSGRIRVDMASPAGRTARYEIPEVNEARPGSETTGATRTAKSDYM